MHSIAIKVVFMIVVLFAVDGKAHETEEVEYHNLEDKWNVDDVVDEELDTDSVFKVTTKNNMKMSDAMESTSASPGKEYHFEFNAFGTNQYNRSEGFSGLGLPLRGCFF